jgi:hypothetical protein
MFRVRFDFIKDKVISSLLMQFCNKDMKCCFIQKDVSHQLVSFEILMFVHKMAVLASHVRMIQSLVI